MESAQRMDLRKYKTKPCRNYHSTTGCTRGDNCFFIHDPNYKGTEIPNFNPRNYESIFPIQIQGMLSPGIGLPQISNLGNQFNQINQLGINQMNLGFNIQQMIGLNGNMNNNLNQNINKEEMVGQNNVVDTGMIQQNLENCGINVGLNNGFINRQFMDQGMNLQGYDFNYGVGLQGQNINQNN